VLHVLTYISSVRSRIFSLVACADGSSLLWLTAGLGGGENARRLLFLKGKEIELFYFPSRSFLYHEYNFFDSRSKEVDSSKHCKKHIFVSIQVLNTKFHAQTEDEKTP